MLQERAFILYDDLAADRPATFTWLYHVLPKRPFASRDGGATVDYGVGDVRVRLQHVWRPDALRVEDRQGLEGMVNPMTGEDYRPWRKGDIVCAHNLWASNASPAREWRFLAVVCPRRKGEPEPRITRIDDDTVAVDGTVVCFNPESSAAGDAALCIDVRAFRSPGRVRE
jgi:hypothetical protein